MLRHYRLHGVPLRVDTNDSRVGEMLDARLRRWAAPSGSEIDLHFTFERNDGAPPTWEPTGHLRLVYEPPLGQVLYDEPGDVLLITCGAGVAARCDVANRSTRISYHPHDPAQLWLATHPVFSLCLVELLRQNSLFGLHAAALARDGRGLLIAGASGSGKSTLTTALLRAGFEFLGDDTCFLRHETAGARVCSFPDEVDVTDRTLEFFPELRHLRGRPLRTGATKHHYQFDELFQCEWSRETLPTTIVFPRVSNASSSCVEPVLRGEALMELIPSILLTNPSRAQSHLDVMGRLADQCDCYRLHTARDFDHLPDLLGSLLAPAAPVAP